MSKGKVIAAIAAVVIVGGVAAAFALSGMRATEVDAAEAVRDDLTVTVSASGKIQADRKVDLYPPTAGTLESIEVTDGQMVRAGQLIAVIDPAPLEVQLAQAEAAYAAAQAQRDATAKAVPGAADRAAADAAVAAAHTAYEAADLQYEAALAGLGQPTAADIAQAEAAVVLAQAAVDAANEAYDAFYESIYLPAPEPRDPALDAALQVLSLARDQAEASLITAGQTLAALEAAASGPVATTAAKLARDQAYAAYLGAVAQRDALARASSIGSALTAADKAIDAAAAARELAENALDATKITAPVDGVVVFSSVSGLIPGGPVVTPTEGSSVTPASAPFSIVSLEDLAFTAQVDEADVTRVEAGMKALVSLDGVPGVEFETEVERVELQAVLTPTGGTAFPVRMRVLNPDQQILIGMNGSVEIAVEMIEDVVTIPVEALLEDRGGNYVFVLEDGTARRVSIEIGKLTDALVEVRSGVTEGDLVITSSVSDLADGARVRVK